MRGLINRRFSEIHRKTFRTVIFSIVAYNIILVTYVTNQDFGASNKHCLLYLRIWSGVLEISNLDLAALSESDVALLKERVDDLRNSRSLGRHCFTVNC